jgi:four helix bundle protein
MAMIQRFEDLLCWQKARQLTNAVYDSTDWPAFTKDFQLRNQIRDAAGSSMHNIAEGFDSGTPGEFIRFLKIARRSASETQSELYLALDRQYIDQNRLDHAYGLATETKRLINGMITHLRQKSEGVR